MSIEFAIIFPVLFLILYAIITYGLAFAAQQTLTQAAAEGARASLRYQAGDDPDMSLRKGAAVVAAETAASWLKQRAPTALTATPLKAQCSYDPALTCIRVDVKYINAGESALVPRLLGVFRLDPPEELRASATVQVNTAF